LIIKFQFYNSKRNIESGQVRRQAPYGDAVYNFKSEENEGEKRNCVRLVVDNVSHKIIQMPSLKLHA
jgi:hypothetical protein